MAVLLSEPQHPNQPPQDILPSASGGSGITGLTLRRRLEIRSLDAAASLSDASAPLSSLGSLLPPSPKAPSSSSPIPASPDPYPLPLPPSPPLPPSSSTSVAPLSSLILTALALLLCAETTFLVGVWASLQFRWIQIENPSVVLALERLLVACIPVAVPALFTWAIVSALGMANAAYYFMAFPCVLYWLFFLPRPSSFRSGKQDPATVGDS